MANDTIKIMIIAESSRPTREMRGKAFLVDTVNKNWVSRKTALELRVKKPIRTKSKVAETWGDLELTSTGVVELHWSRRDVSTPISYSTAFHVTEEEIPHIIIGHELLLERSSIRNPKDNIHVLQSTKQTEGKPSPDFPTNNCFVSCYERAHTDSKAFTAQKAEEKKRAAESAREKTALDAWIKDQEAKRRQQNQAGPSGGTSNSSTDQPATGNRP